MALRSLKSNRKRKLDPKLVIARDLLVTPFEGCVGSYNDPLDNMDKLYMAFGDGVREIFRVQSLAPVKIKGMWWDGPLRVEGTKTLKPNRICYIRNDSREPTIDIEAQITIRRGNVVSCNWQVCTIDRNRFKLIEACFGPFESVCSTLLHK